MDFQDPLGRDLNHPYQYQDHKGFQEHREFQASLELQAYMARKETWAPKVRKVLMEIMVSREHLLMWNKLC